MSEDDVYPGEMDAPNEFDDQDAEALLSGSGRGIDPQLADLFDDMHVAYVSQPPVVGSELAAVLAEADPAPAASPTRRFERMRSSLVAKAGAAAAALVAATGGLAVAHALPDSMQNAASDIGIGAPAHRGHHAGEAREIEPEDSTSTTLAHTSTSVAGHGRDDAVGHDANDDDQGVVGEHHDGNDDGNECEVENETEHGTVTSTTVCVPTTATTVPENHDNRGPGGDDNNEHTTVTTVPESHDGGNEGPGSVSGSDSRGSDDGQTTTPTTTSHSSGGDDSHSGSSDGGSSNDG